MNVYDFTVWAYIGDSAAADNSFRPNPLHANALRGNVGLDWVSNFYQGNQRAEVADGTDVSAMHWWARLAEGNKPATTPAAAYGQSGIYRGATQKFSNGPQDSRGRGK
jgi:hypothetical protein